MNIEKMLSDFYDSIKKVDEKLCETSKTTTLIFENLSNLKDTSNNFKLNENTCKYELAPLKIKLPNKPAKCFPVQTKKIEIILEVRNSIAFLNDEDTILDLIKRLHFDILIKCNKTNKFCAWHLDKHSQLKNDGDGDGENKYIHLEYHFTCGGTKMEESITDFGETLLLRSPRLMHPPLDVILGIDFVINQFIHKDYSRYFTNNSSYQNIVSEMKKLLWKPYCLALANNFYKKWGDGLNFEKGYSESLIG